MIHMSPLDGSTKPLSRRLRRRTSSLLQRVFFCGLTSCQRHTPRYNVSVEHRIDAIRRSPEGWFLPADQQDNPIMHPANDSRDTSRDFSRLLSPFPSGSDELYTSTAASKGSYPSRDSLNQSAVIYHKSVDQSDSRVHPETVYEAPFYSTNSPVKWPTMEPSPLDVSSVSLGKLSAGSRDISHLGNFYRPTGAILNNETGSSQRSKVEVSRTPLCSSPYGDSRKPNNTGRSSGRHFGCRDNKALQFHTVLGYDDTVHGSPMYHASSPLHNAGSPMYHASRQLHDTGRPLYHASSPAYSTSSSLYNASSPACDTGSPLHHASSPLHDTGSPMYHASSPKYLADVVPVITGPSCHENKAYYYLDVSLLDNTHVRADGAGHVRADGARLVRADGARHVRADVTKQTNHDISTNSITSYVVYDGYVTSHSNISGTTPSVRYMTSSKRMSSSPNVTSSMKSVTSDIPDTSSALQITDPQLINDPSTMDHVKRDPDPVDHVGTITDHQRSRNVTGESRCENQARYPTYVMNSSLQQYNHGNHISLNSNSSNSLCSPGDFINRSTIHGTNRSTISSMYLYYTSAGNRHSAPGLANLNSTSNLCSDSSSRLAASSGLPQFDRCVDTYDPRVPRIGLHGYDYLGLRWESSLLRPRLKSPHRIPPPKVPERIHFPKRSKLDKNVFVNDSENQYFLTTGTKISSILDQYPRDPDIINQSTAEYSKFGNAPTNHRVAGVNHVTVSTNHMLEPSNNFIYQPMDKMGDYNSFHNISKDGGLKEMDPGATSHCHESLHVRGPGATSHVHGSAQHVGGPGATSDVHESLPVGDSCATDNSSISIKNILGLAKDSRPYHVSRRHDIVTGAHRHVTLTDATSRANRKPWLLPGRYLQYATGKHRTMDTSCRIDVSNSTASAYSSGFGSTNEADRRRYSSANSNLIGCDYNDDDSSVFSLEPPPIGYSSSSSDDVTADARAGRSRGLGADDIYNLMREYRTLGKHRPSPLKLDNLTPEQRCAELKMEFRRKRKSHLLTS